MLYIMRVGRLMNFRLAVCLLALLAGSRPAAAQTVSVWLTTDDQSQLLQSQAPVAFSPASTGTNCVAVDENQVYQPIEGFGAAFTDTTGYILNEMATAAVRTNALRNLFTRTGNGIGLSFMRLPMGASDLARYQYSYDDLASGTDTNLASFSIAHDLVDIVPLIRSARQLNPQMKLMANPWSPPGWMKSSGSMVGGTLLTNMYGPFANYFVKFIQAYQAQGIVVDYIGLQNEPLYQPTDYPGMSMDAATQLAVLRDYVLPAFAANQLTNKVLVYDHNWDGSDYPSTVLADAGLAASNQVAGIAWHGYSGTPGVMLALANAYSSKGNYETEHSGGAWVSDQVRNDFEEIIHVMRSWGRCYVKWNLAGDQDDGPHSGGCGDCTPLVTVNSSSGAITYTADFYTLGHFSRFVLPGAHRIYSANGAGILSAAFANTNGSRVLVAFNDSTNRTAFQVQWNGQSFAYTLASYSGATFAWTGTQSNACVISATNPIQASSFNSVSNLETETTSDAAGGYDVGYASTGSYAVYQNVDLGAGFAGLNARFASSGAGGSLAFRLDAPAGPLLGTVAIPVTGGWQTWQTQAGTVYGGSGVHDLYLVFSGGSGIGNFNWFQLTGAYAALPAPWANTDIGSIALAGGASCASGVFTVSGSGDDIWNSADAFHFVRQPVAGACEIRARVVSVGYTDPWAKAGVMLRDGTAAGAVNAAVVLTATNGVEFQARTTNGAASVSTVISGVYGPCWTRLARTPGGVLAGYYSADGTNWTLIGSNAGLALGNSTWAGLAVTAHNNASNCVAVLDNVTVNQAPVLAAVTNQTTVAGRTVIVTNLASDADVPVQTLNFSLLKSPSGAALSTNTGVFTWRPAIAQAATTQAVTVVVSDTGTPVLSATQSFAVSVTAPSRPTLSAQAASITNGQFGLLLRGDAGPDYIIQFSTNLVAWSTAATVTPARLPWFWTDTNSLSVFPHFYRVLLGP